MKKSRHLIEKSLFSANIILSFIAILLSGISALSAEELYKPAPFLTGPLSYTSPMVAYSSPLAQNDVIPTENSSKSSVEDNEHTRKQHIMWHRIVYHKSCR
jgi:hypothetical protein